MYQIGDFFEMFFQDAITASQVTSFWMVPFLILFFFLKALSIAVINPIVSNYFTDITFS